MPAVAANAQTDEEIAVASGLLKEKADGLSGADAAEWTEGLGEVETALEDVKAKAPDLDYLELDAAIVDLRTAIDGGDVAEMEAAGVTVSAAVEAVVAAAGADAGDGTPAPSSVATGDAVPTTGPNVALLTLAGALVLMAGGALALRRSRLT
jgi:hypothetical protein